MQTFTGQFAKLMVKAGGVGEAGDFTEVAVTRDVEVALTKKEANVKTRGSQGWDNLHPAGKVLELSGELLYDPDDDGYQIMHDAFWNDTAVGMQALDAENGQGAEGDFHIFEFSRSEGIDGALTVKFTAKVARSDNPPEWTGGA
jgi:hypothetical protein